VFGTLAGMSPEKRRAAHDEQVSPRSRPRAPCRLVVYLAPAAPIGLVLRRGPSAWTRLSVWHTDTDTFEHGQWLHGQVYERRCDVSVDGRLFIYFASQRGSRARVRAHGVDTWIVISRPPWFTALALWLIGGTYHTGGYFPASRSVWIGYGEEPPDQGQLPRWLRLAPGLPAYIDRTNNWTERTVYINRLLRDGWEPVAPSPTETWQRRHPHQPLTLLMTQTGYDYQSYGGPYIVEYAVRLADGAVPIPLGRATWADWDQHGRLILAQTGRLVHWMPPGTLREIADFNPQVPEAIPPPAQACVWPPRPRRAP
jgi:hypothetical protein